MHAWYDAKYFSKFTLYALFLFPIRKFMVYEYEANTNHHYVSVFVSLIFYALLCIRKLMVYEYEANKNHRFVSISVSLIFFVSLGWKSNRLLSKCLNH